MSAPRQGRGVWTKVFRNFIDSFSARKAELKGNFIGEDLNGNKFYENPADPRRGKRLSRRSFEPAKEMHFDVSNMSAEWDAWLRHRRQDPPTIEELTRNLQIAQMKAENAQKIAEKEGKIMIEQKHTHMTDYPRYEEYEVNPGQVSTNQKSGK